MASESVPSGRTTMTMLMLQQADRALVNVEYVRKDFGTALGAGPANQHEMELFEQFREADVCCHEQLEVAVYVARLTSAPGYQTASRLERLRQLIDSLVHAAQLLLQAAKEIKTNGSVECWEVRKSQFDNAVQMVSSSMHCLELICSGGNSLPVSVMAKECSPDDQTSPVDAEGLHQRLDVHRYLHDKPWYDWRRNIELITAHPGFSEDEQAEMVVERNASSYKQIGTITQALWNNMPLDGDGVETGERLRFDNINAVWLSPNADSVMDKADPQAYRDLFDAITNTAHDPKLKHRQSRYEPLCLARALFDMGIDLGILFDDDLSVLVWPFGKANAVRGHYVVVQCGYYGLLGWRYRVVTRVQKCSVRPLTQRSPEKHRAASTASNTVKPTVGALAGHREPQQKPVSFLDLPAELRNTIYADYLTFEFKGHDDDHINMKLKEYYVWTHHWQELATVVLPEICVTCRQIRDEVVPLYLSSKQFHFRLAWKRDSKGLRRGGSAMTSWNKWLSTVPNSAYLRDVEFHPHKVGSGCIGLSLRTEAPGFELKVRLRTRDRHQGSHPVVVDWEARLRELVRIIVQDRVTDGLSVADVAAIADFLYVHVER